MMISPKYDYGEEVRVIRNIRNDIHEQGDFKKGEVIIRRGTTGYVRQSGVYQQDQIIYQIHFLESGITVGCKETELIKASLSWQQNAFEYGDTATLVVAIGMEGSVIGQKGDEVKVIAVDRSDERKFTYRIQIKEYDVIVPESALLGASYGHC